MCLTRSLLAYLWALLVPTDRGLRRTRVTKKKAPGAWYNHLGVRPGVLGARLAGLSLVKFRLKTRSKKIAEVFPQPPKKAMTHLLLTYVTFFLGTAPPWTENTGATTPTICHLHDPRWQLHHRQLARRRCCCRCCVPATPAAPLP
jgi:hypothetical protein